MKKIVVDDIYEIIGDIIDLYDNDSDKKIVVVGYYEIIQEAMNTIIKMVDDVRFVGGQLDEYDYDGYDDAWYLELQDGGIYTGKIYNDLHDCYLMMETDYAFVEEDFIDQYLETNSSHGVTEFGFDDVHDSDDTAADSNACVCKTDDGYGFTFCDHSDGNHYKFTYRGTKKLTDDMIHDLLCEYVFD